MCLRSIGCIPKTTLALSPTDFGVFFNYNYYYYPTCLPPEERLQLFPLPRQSSLAGLHPGGVALTAPPLSVPEVAVPLGQRSECPTPSNGAGVPPPFHTGGTHHLIPGAIFLLHNGVIPSVPHQRYTIRSKLAVAPPCNVRGTPSVPHHRCPTICTMEVPLPFHDGSNSSIPDVTPPVNTDITPPLQTSSLSRLHTGCDPAVQYWRYPLRLITVVAPPVIT